MAVRLSRQRRWIARHRATVAAGTVGTAAAVVVGVVLGIGSGVVAPNLPEAFASWKATPTTPAPGQLSAADAECVAADNQLATQSPDSSKYQGSWRPVLDDTRSTDTLVLMTAASATSNDFGACLTDVATPNGEPVYWGAVNPGRAAAEPGALAGIAIGGNGKLQDAIGEAGPGLTGASFTLPDGTVVATVGGGLFAAWWPSTLTPVSVTVTSTYGTVTEQFPAPGTPVGQIPAGEVGPAGTTTPPPDAPNS